MPIYDPMRILAPIEVDGDITHWDTRSRYSGNPAPVRVATAAVPLLAGQFVTLLWSVPLTSYRAYVASANQTTNPAMGYVTANVNSGGNAFVHFGGINDKVTIGNPTGNVGAPVWLGLNGAATLTPPPEVAGTLAQRLGTLINPNQILFEPESPITLQNAIAGKVIPVVYASGMLREITPTDVLPDLATTALTLGKTGVQDGELRLNTQLGAGVMHLRSMVTQTDVTLNLPQSYGPPGSVLTDLGGLGWLSWERPPGAGLKPYSGRMVPLWPCTPDDVSITISPTDMIVSRVVVDVAVTGLSLFITAGPADIVVVAYDDSQYPYPGSLVNSLPMSVETSWYGTDFQIPAGTWWLGIHNIGVTDVTVRSTRSTNPFSPGVSAIYDPGTMAYGGLQLGGFGPDTPPFWPSGNGNDSLGCMFLIGGA